MPQKVVFTHDKVDTAFGMKENWLPAHFCRISPREEEVTCTQSALHMLRFNFEGRNVMVYLIFGSDDIYKQAKQKKYCMVLTPFPQNIMCIM